MLLTVTALVAVACDSEGGAPGEGTDAGIDDRCAAVSGRTYRWSPPEWPDDRPAPETLEASLSALEEVMSEEQKTLLSCPDVRVPPGQIHRGLAMWMRNRWQLYQDDSPLRADVARFGISHPDDVSTLIARALLAELRGQPVEMERWAAESLERREEIRRGIEAAQEAAVNDG